MSDSQVFGPDGFLANIQGEYDPRQPWTELVTPEGQLLMVPTEVLTARTEGGFHLASSLADLGLADMADRDSRVIPIIHEELLINKVRNPTGWLRVVKGVTEETRNVEETCTRDDLEVVRIPRNEVVLESPPVRYEGEMTIFPIVEEVLVLEKRLVLREEIHVRRRQTQELQSKQVTLRKEYVELTRLQPPGVAVEAAT
jgi:uncharacterized protein (TIGR02271 family)